MQKKLRAIGHLRICVLGGTGFVGRQLAARLCADGHELRILTRDPARHRRMLVLPTVRLIKTGVLDEPSLQREFDGCDAVINLIGILNETGRDGRGFRAAHVEVPRRIVAACQATGVPRLLHMSALKAEANAPSQYLVTKAEGEALVRAAQSARLAVTIFQPSVIFGPEDSFINRFASLLRLPLAIFPVPRPNARFAPVYVGDVAEAFARALRNRESYGKTYQLCGPRVYSLKEIIALTARTMGVRRRLVGMSDTLTRLQARIGDLIPGKPFSTDNYLSMNVHSICDKDGLAQLGITPTSGESVIPQYLAGSNEQTRYNRYRRNPDRY